MIKLRPATMADAARLYAWRYDPATVVASREDPPASFQQHCRWLELLLDNPDNGIDLYIARDISQSRTVGTVRLDFTAEGTVSIAEVSITVDPQWRGRGYAAEMLAAIVAEKQADTLVAFVKDGNHSSLRLFWEAGFRVADGGEETRDRVPLMRLEYAYAAQ